MLTLEQCREIDPRLNDLSDEEAQRIIDDLYGLAELALDSWGRRISRDDSISD